MSQDIKTSGSNVSLDSKGICFWRHRKNMHSQNGEDGIVQYLLTKLGITEGWVCEFGAADGRWLSNTFNLVKTGKFKGVYIEADETKFVGLAKLATEYPNIIPFHKMVSGEKNHANSLDNILGQTTIPIDFDLLSIDVDSCDYFIWACLEKYRPKIVIIEINSSVLPSADFIVHGPNGSDGTSYLPTVKLGLAKGYRLVCHVGNLIWLRNDLVSKLENDLCAADPLTDPFCYFLTEWLPEHLRGAIHTHQQKLK
jgi:hypothetical protein